MDQDQRRAFLIEALLAERADGSRTSVPPDAEGQRSLLRALMNVRAPTPVADDVLSVQDASRSGAGRSTPQRFPSSTPWTPRSPGSRSGAATSPASRRTPS